MGLERNEAQHENEVMATSLVVRSTVPSFVRSGFRPDFPDNMLRARVSVEMMQRGSPLFLETEGYKLRGAVDLALMPTGLESYILDMGMKEAVRFLANEGNRDRNNLRRYFDGDGSVVRRADELLVDGKIDQTNSHNAERDFRILTFEDVSAGVIVARLRGGMSVKAEAFRDETHALVGDARHRYRVDGEGRSRIASVTVPIVTRHLVEEKVSLAEILSGLKSEELSGWFHMVRLFAGKIKGPHARLFLNELRTAFLPL